MSDPDTIFATLEPRSFETLSDEAFRRRRSHDLAALSAAPAGAGRRTLLRLAPAALLGAALVGVGVAALPRAPRAPGPAETGGELDATGTLRLAANRAGNATTLVVPQGKFVYTHSRRTGLGKAPVPGGAAFYLHETDEKHWAATAGLLPTRFVITSGINARPLTPQEGERLAKSTYKWAQQRVTRYPDGDGQAPPAAPPGAGTEPGPLFPTPEYLASLPTDPQRLLGTLRAALAPGKAAMPAATESIRILGLVGRLVTHADVLLSPELRATFYQLLSALPGIERVPGETEIGGRKGIAIGLVNDFVRHELIIDPQTARCLGTRRVAVVEHRIGDSTIVPPGTVLDVHHVVEQRIVDSTD